jgi:hypothetical protein
MLFASAAAYMGFLGNDKFRDALEMGNEQEVAVAIRELVKNDPSKSEEGRILIDAIDLLQSLPGRTLSELRLHAGFIISESEVSRGVPPEETFDWSHSLIAILKSAAMQGFRLSTKTAESSQEVVVPPMTKTKSLKTVYKREPETIGEYTIAECIEDMRSNTCVLSWKKNNIVVAPTSSMRARYVVVREFFNNCARMAAEGDFVLWIIDDQGVYGEAMVEELLKRAREMSKGLKHSFVFQYTPRSKITYLVEFLLNVSRAK